KVLLVDDVISTGGSMKAMKEITEKAGGQVIGEAAILAEGDAAKREDIIFLAPLPLFEAE
ncbi:MAG: phosphoribosyltransferase family protein, partial [Dialister sp.]|nr:phosphoribosyltransferase family protein [Dialister sp.]